VTRFYGLVPLLKQNLAARISLCRALTSLSISTIIVPEFASSGALYVTRLRTRTRPGPAVLPRRVISIDDGTSSELWVRVWF
jgi:hypothetical protein